MNTERRTQKERQNIKQQTTSKNRMELLEIDCIQNRQLVDKMIKMRAGFRNLTLKSGISRPDSPEKERHWVSKGISVGLFQQIFSLSSSAFYFQFIRLFSAPDGLCQDIFSLFILPHLLSFNFPNKQTIYFIIIRQFKNVSLQGSKIQDEGKGNQLAQYVKVKKQILTSHQFVYQNIYMMFFQYSLYNLLIKFTSHNHPKILQFSFYPSIITIHQSIFSNFYSSQYFCMISKAEESNRSQTDNRLQSSNQPAKKHAFLKKDTSRRLPVHPPTASNPSQTNSAYSHSNASHQKKKQSGRSHHNIQNGNRIQKGKQNEDNTNRMTFGNLMTKNQQQCSFLQKQDFQICPTLYWLWRAEHMVNEIVGTNFRLRNFSKGRKEIRYSDGSVQILYGNLKLTKWMNGDFKLMEGEKVSFWSEQLQQIDQYYIN